MTAEIYYDPHNEIHYTAIIGASVIMGKGNKIGPYTVIYDGTVIGNSNQIGAFCCIGTPAEYERPPAGSNPGRVVIGDGNVIREYVNINAAILTNETRIGSRCYIMNHSHIAHDCKLGDEVRLSGGVKLCGSVVIGEGSRIGAGTVILQRHTVGKYSQVGMNCQVTGNIDDFETWVNFDRAKFLEKNEIGIENYKRKYNIQ